MSQLYEQTAFADREDAGRHLGQALRALALQRPLVLALPRGGVPVGREVARALNAPLDVWVVRKVGVPWQPELALGAVAEGGGTHFNASVTTRAGLSRDDIVDIVRQKRHEVEERTQRFRCGREPPDLSERTVIIVDDGIATGATALAAIASIRAQSPKRIVLAVPIASASSIDAIAPQVETVVCLREVDNLGSVGDWYGRFDQVGDGEVLRLLDAARLDNLQSAPRAS